MPPAGEGGGGGRAARGGGLLRLLRLLPLLELRVPARLEDVAAVGALLLLARAAEPHALVREEPCVQRLDAEAQARVARELVLEVRDAALHLLALARGLAPLDPEEVHLEARL